MDKLRDFHIWQTYGRCCKQGEWFSQPFLRAMERFCSFSHGHSVLSPSLLPARSPIPPPRYTFLADVICVNGEGGDVVFILKGVGWERRDGWVLFLPSTCNYAVSNDH